MLVINTYSYYAEHSKRDYQFFFYAIFSAIFNSRKINIDCLSEISSTFLWCLQLKGLHGAAKLNETEDYEAPGSNPNQELCNMKMCFSIGHSFIFIVGYFDS